MASLQFSKTSFLVGTRSVALSPGARVLDIRGLHVYSLDSIHHVGQCLRDLKISLFFATTGMALLSL